ncbi:hypothetical protein ACFW4M_07560 [Streptomyces sp. NPDC058794]|uniref:hypothetical protein n=1 Tax=Streptomyces TaxID=1883 RepID=UPI0022BA50BA|nr:hypothetical protein [Streptomyces mutabilis]MCZ9354109.1 hypothetical protein [Streptomyces mutabilis]
MNHRDRVIARSVARYWAQRLFGIVAIGAFTLLGLVALTNGPETFIFFLKRGSLSSLIAIFVVATSAWLLLLMARARANRHESA